ncbi:MAG TPA: TRAP transporter small permease subunit [Spirochaetia bacterium]|nr:TRAP transporter small permease subunit [Spirochaetia bacterium]
MMRTLVKILNLIHIILVYFAELLLVVMVLLIFVNVVLRYVFNSGILWSDEVALLIAVWFSFIAMALGVKLRLHIHINVLSAAHISAGLDSLLWKLRDVVVVFVGAGLLIWGRILVGFTMRSILPATGWPAGTLYAIVPVAAVLIILDGLVHLFNIDADDVSMDDYLTGHRSLLSLFRKGQGDEPDTGVKGSDHA